MPHWSLTWKCLACCEFTAVALRGVIGRGLAQPRRPLTQADADSHQRPLRTVFRSPHQCDAVALLIASSTAGTPSPWTIASAGLPRKAAPQRRAWRSRWRLASACAIGTHPSLLQTFLKLTVDVGTEHVADRQQGGPPTLRQLLQVCVDSRRFAGWEFQSAWAEYRPRSNASRAPVSGGRRAP